MQLLRETWLLFRRQLWKRMRSPAWFVFGLVQPILYLALFGPLASRAAETMLGESGGGWQLYVPGLLVQLAIAGTSYAGFGLIAEWRLGILDRLRVTPASRLALLLGRVLCDALMLLAQAALLITVATAFGLRVPLVGVLLAFGFVLLVGISVAALSYTAALWTKSEDVYAPLLSAVVVPVMLLSGVLLPMTMAPQWLDWLSSLNPLRHIVDAMREAFHGNFSLAAIGTGLISAIVLAVASVAIGTRTFRRENA